MRIPLPLNQQPGLSYPCSYKPEMAAVLRPYLLDPHAPADYQSLHFWLSGFWQRGEAIQTYTIKVSLSDSQQAARSATRFSAVSFKSLKPNITPANLNRDVGLYNLRMTASAINALTRHAPWSGAVFAI